MCLVVSITQSNYMGNEAFSSLLPILQYLTEAAAHTAYTLAAARSASHSDTTFCN